MKQQEEKQEKTETKKEVKQKECKHKWKHVRILGRCFSRWECILCGKISDIDSGD